MTGALLKGLILVRTFATLHVLNKRISANYVEAGILSSLPLSCFEKAMRSALFMKEITICLIHSHQPSSLCRPFQEVDMEPLAEADLPHLEHLELRVQNTTGFGARQLEPLSSAKLPNLK